MWMLKKLTDRTLGKIFILGVCVSFLTLFGLYCTQGIYSDGYLLQNIYESSFSNDKARIDILNTDGAIINVQEKDELEIKYPIDSWCLKDNGDNCATITIQPSNQWTEHRISLTALESGKTKIKLMGPYRKNDKGTGPILVDYKMLTVDKDQFIPMEQTVWHDKSFKTKNFSLRKGQNISFSVMLRRHPFAWKDLTEFYHFNIKKFFYSLVGCLLVACIIVSLLYYIQRKYSFNRQFYFILIVLCLLILPVMNLSKEKVSDQENRTLARWPKIINNGEINQKFGPEFDEWLNDHLGARQQLIDLRFSLLYRLNGKIANENAFVGDDGWMFETKGTKYVDSIEKQRKQIEENVDILKRFVALLKVKDMTVYLIPTPDRNEILQKYWESYYPPKPRINKEAEYQKLLKGTKIHLVPIQKALKETNKTYPIFYKGDVHTNKTGNSILYRQVFRALKQQKNELKNIQGFLCDKTFVEKNVVFSIAAKLGFPLRQNLSYPGQHYVIKGNLPLMHTANIKELKIVQQTAGHYKGENRTMYQHNILQKAPINELLVSIGPCYNDNLFSKIAPLFKESIKIRNRDLTVSSAGTREYILNKIKKVIKSTHSNLTLIIFDDPEGLQSLAHAMKGL